MDKYTQKTKEWLDKRFAEGVKEGAYFAHQPIYGYKRGRTEGRDLIRYLRNLSILTKLSYLKFDSFMDIGGAEGYMPNLVKTASIGENPGRRVLGHGKPYFRAVPGRARFAIGETHEEFSLWSQPARGFRSRDLVCHRGRSIRPDFEKPEPIPLRPHRLFVRPSPRSPPGLHRYLYLRIAHHSPHHFACPGFDTGFPPLLRLKPDRALGLGSRGSKQFPDRLEHDLKLMVVFLFYLFDLLSQSLKTTGTVLANLLLGLRLHKNRP